MHAIWKYQLLPNRVNHVTMPTGATVLAAQNQHGHVTLWARVDPALAPVVRKFAVRMTGDHYEPCSEKYVGTVQLDGGGFVAHVFELL